jgi:2-polyprenyl-3-methyl-5-hydroxy-6-metoxy-1,4-benzoquinol methylase
MSAVVDVGAFRRRYRQAVADVLPFLTPDRLAVIARHNPGWDPRAFDHEEYLRNSETRYVTALETFMRNGGAGEAGALRVLEVGGFMAAFPIALARVGVRTTLSEEYDYYYGAFDALRDYATAEGVEIWPLDLTEPLEQLPTARFDLVTAMAILEHLAHSPRTLLRNCRELLAENGRLVADLPNIAYWPTRLGLLRGQSPLAPIAQVYDAEVPFTGHHREYTSRELRAVLTWSGFTVDELLTYNYSPWPDRRLLRRLIADLPRTWIPELRELLMACARRGPEVDSRDL